MRALALLFALLGGCATGSAPGPSAASILAEMKAACGGEAWRDVQGWHETGAVEMPGAPPMTHEVWHDMHGLKTAMVSRVEGRVVRHAGFNGSVYWQVGPDGKSQVGQDPARVRRQRRDAYLSSSGWFLPERFPATIVIAGTEAAEGRRFDVLRITPADAEPFDLWVDRESHRIARIVAGDEYVHLAEYRMFGGICSATRGRQGDSDPAHEIVLHVESVETATPIPAATFEPQAP